jgi:hypothetical protein
MPRVLGALLIAAACGGQSTGSHNVGPVLVSISPTTANVAVGASVIFTATMTGAADKAVTWSVRESGGGSISQSGHYVAPNASGAFHVVAASNADPSAVGQAEVTVRESLPPITISINPQTAQIPTGGTVQFAATVGGSTDTAVAFSAPDGGSVTAGGLFTAPGAAGTFRVVATALADSSKTATATVQVSVPAQVSISVSPSTFSIQTGAARQLTASVVGANDTGVLWSVEESGGGTVDANGLYTAPSAPGTFHVVATSHADPTARAVAEAHVTAAAQPSIAISPRTATVGPGAAIQFQATVTGLNDNRVAYSADAGSIDATSGAYTAPTRAGDFHVTAASIADPTLTATATITVVVQNTIAVTIKPASAQTTPGGTVQLTASVTGAADTSVIWSIQEGSSGGSIDQTGLYTSPTNATGTWHVVATSHADSTKQAVADVTSYNDLIDQGGQILPEVHVYALWWGPPSDFPSDMRTAAETFFSSINGSNYLGIIDQYLRGASASVSFVKSITDSSTPSPSIGIDQELCSQLAANGMIPDSKGVYFVYSSTPSPAGACGGHSFIQCNGATVLVADVENPSGSPCDAAAALHCNAMTSATQSLIDISAHELMESITDPLRPIAWRDVSGEEVADKCDWVFSACVQLGPQKWQLQELYSNAVHTCVQGQ